MFASRPFLLVLVRASLAVLALGVAGCADNSPPNETEPTGETAEQLAADSTTTTGETTANLRLGRVAFDTLTSPGDIADSTAAVRKSMATTTSVRDPRCVEKKLLSANVVAFTLKGCRGPFGEADVTGDLVAVYSRPAGAASLSIVVGIPKGGSLVIDGRPVSSFAAGVELVATQSGVTVGWASETRRTTRAGVELDHRTKCRLTFDAASECLVFDGSAAGSVDGRGLTVDVSDYRVCADGCPRSGVLRATESSTERSLVITIDGEMRAEVTGFDGTSFDVAICQGTASGTGVRNTALGAATDAVR